VLADNLLAVEAAHSAMETKTIYIELVCCPKF
jgi:hypothetical protein